MPRRLSHVIKQPLKLQRIRRKYKRNVGEQGTTYLAKVSGSVYGTITGHFWVHDASGVDSNSKVTYGAPYQLPLLPGASIDPRPDLKVETIVQDGRRYVARMAFNELVRMGYNPHQTNPLDPRRKWLLIEQLQNLQSFPYSGMSVRVMPSIYRKSSGQYGFYAGSTSIDLTSYIPSATDTQSIVCLWLDITDNTISITSSTEISRDTDLKSDPGTAMTYINECASNAPTDAIGITSYILFDDTSAVVITNKFHDLRGILGTGGGGSGSYRVISSTYTIASGKDAFFIGPVLLTGTLTVEGEVAIL